MISNNIKIECPLENEQSKKFFLKYGYIKFENVIPLSVLQNLINLADKHLNVENGKFNYSLMQQDTTDNVNIHNELLIILKYLLEEFFKNFKVHTASFLIKPSMFNEEMYLHQDWTFTFEDKFSPLTLWIPLQDVTPENGGLFLLPKSHNVFNNYRSLNYPTARFTKEGMIGEYVEDIYLNKGDFFMFHPAVFHGSYPNLSMSNRLAVTATVLSSEAPYIHVKKHNDDTAQIEYIDEFAFLSDLKQLTDKDAFKGDVSEKFQYKHQVPSKEDLQFRLKEL